MLNGEGLQPRLSSHPWGLYRAEHLARKRPDVERDGFYTHMLRDDLQKQRYAYELSLVPTGAEWSRASQVIFALLNDFSHTGYGRDPAAVVCDFVDSLLEESTSGESLLLELHSLPSESNRAKARDLGRPETPEAESQSLPSLGLIPNWSVKQTRSGPSQVSPDADRPPVTIPGARVQRLRLRDGNRTDWKRAIRELRQVDATKAVGAEVDRFSWEGYSFSDVVATQNLAVATTTARIGWDGRGTFAELVTSPYSVYRRLRFVRFWAEAVEDSVAFLNQFTSSESLYGSDAFTFSLSGLPAPQDLTEAMRDIRSGSLTVGKAHDTFLFPKYAKRRASSTDES